ncbi:MAG: hypothetical protein V1820_01725 [archaeon]
MPVISPPTDREEYLRAYYNAMKPEEVEFLESLEQTGDGDPIDVRNAKLAFIANHYFNFEFRTCSAFRRGYFLLEELDETVKGIDLAPFLRRNKKDGFKPDYPKYSITSIRVSPEGRKSDDCWKGPKCPDRVQILPDGTHLVHKYYIDAPAGFEVCFSGEPICYASFFPSSEDALTIRQLQGVRFIDASRRIFRGTRPLVPFNYKGILLDVSTEIARALGYSQIGIQTGQAHPSTRLFYPETGAPHLPLENALRIYDAFAEANGFEQGPDSNWYRSLAQTG